MKKESHLSLSEGGPGGQEEEAEGQGSTECFVHFQWSGERQGTHRAL